MCSYTAVRMPVQASDNLVGRFSVLGLQVARAVRVQLSLVSGKHREDSSEVFRFIAQS